MKIRKPNMSLIRGTASKEKAERTDNHARLEAVDQFERFDQNGSGQSRQEQDEEVESTEQVLAAILDDPVLFRETEWPALVGLDTLSPSMEAAMTGLLNMVEPEKD